MLLRGQSSSPTLLNSLYGFILSPLQQSPGSPTLFNVGMSSTAVSMDTVLLPTWSSSLQLERHLTGGCFQVLICDPAIRPWVTISCLVLTGFQPLWEEPHCWSWTPGWETTATVRILSDVRSPYAAFHMVPRPLPLGFLEGPIIVWAAK